MPNDDEYEIGYAKPPKNSQFKKGKSGNPRGRPKKEPSIPALFRKVAKQKVVTNGPHGQQHMTKLEAAVTQLINKAANGNMKVINEYLRMAARFPELISDPWEPQKIVLQLVESKGEQ